MRGVIVASSLLALFAVCGCPTAADPCPGGSGEAICCDADETACGTSADPWGEACCSSEEECHNCYDPGWDQTGGICLPIGEECEHTGPVD